ncbi:bifunctional 2-polyprenyl-6-hydroxyphenol methylase/3-demethylubiquinol 3-O-methyltransferase UbiG [Methanobrevibacter sp.]|uniref:class I SAM-dependent methyltransferase n=1 Tax=Methanobrevibacter sp. TaxID=66852 RepID=UPI0026E0B9B6|nr:class I SAM-dependent methyltransferase [Methanobrevibacter sp.]MDO5861103.1 class I SAM-dependent methyltransferase [Methanobrevibacter sp.]
MHKSSMLKMEYFKTTYLNPNDNLKILDIGSFDKTGNYNYGMVLNEKNWTYHGLDLKEGNNVDIIVENPYDWQEVEEESYDVVITGQALEHIEFFWLTLEQINRVLKPGGFCCIIVPSAGPVHKNPYDCYRFQDDGVKALAEYIKLRVIEYGTTDASNSNPWFDSYVIARKPDKGSKEELENRMDDIERKMDLILEKLKG